jgi:acylphosphatase
MAAKQIFYTGKVQGVGFRYATKQIATGFDVVGWVRNLPDGRVEMQVMSLDPAELDAFLEEVEQNSPLRNHIKEKETHTVPPLQDVKGFSIVH